MTLLDRVMSRVVEEEGCWVWRGATQHVGATPVIRTKDGTVSVRRALLTEAGRSLRRSQVATYQCGNFRCVLPAHTVVLSRSALSIRTNRMPGRHSSPALIAKLTQAARRRAKLGPEQVAAIRAAEGTQKEIAARYGISQSHVSSIRRGVVWQTPHPFAPMVHALVGSLRRARRPR